jgi:hypothetical protein
MTAEKKRPLGLGKASKAISTTTTESAEVTKKLKSDIADDEVMVQLGDDSSLPQDLDEVSQLEGIFDAALNKWVNEGNEEEAKMLFRGVIHECDKLVRKACDPPKDADPIEKSLLNPQFYLIYGNALYRYGLLQSSPEEAMDYLEAALEQYELGLSKWTGVDSVSKLHQAIAFVLLHKASEIAITDIESSEELALKAVEHMDKAVSDESSPRSSLLLENGLAIQKYADMREDEQGRMEWNTKAIETFELIQDNEVEYADALMGQGQACLSQANCFAENVTREDEVCTDPSRAKALLEEGTTISRC